MLKNKNEKFICVICNLSSTGYGNNPNPISVSGRCCDICDENVVIPTRIKSIIQQYSMPNRSDIANREVDL